MINYAVIAIIGYCFFLCLISWLIKKWDRQFWLLLNGRQFIKFFIGTMILLMGLPCASKIELMMAWQMGILFVLAYMDSRTMQVYQSLIWLLSLLSLLLLNNVNKNNWSCFWLCLIFLCLSKINVYNWADAFALCNVVLIVSVCSLHVYLDMIILFTLMEIIFIVQGIVKMAKQKKSLQRAMQQRMPLFPAIAIALYVYLIGALPISVGCQ